jgi:hypothetical protein
MKYWTVAGVIFFVISTALALTYGTVFSVVLGLCIGLSLFAIVYSMQKEAPPPPSDNQETARLQDQIKAIHSQASEEIEALSKKLKLAQEKCDSYKKLVDVHQVEIEKQRLENQRFIDESLAKGRKISELQLFLEDPKAFSEAEAELFYKNQLEDKSSQISQFENKLINLQSEVEEKEAALTKKLLESQQEKVRLETELASMQDLVTKLSVKKKSNKKK